jgi:hypothetical protein
MSTKISINVDTSELSAKALEETLANRQVFSIRKDRQRSAEKGERSLRASRRENGLDPATGEPVVTGEGLQGSSFLATRRIDEEPGATRRRPPETVGMAWIACRRSGFSAGSFWSNGPGVSGQDGTIQYISRSNEYRVKVGSGDGKNWVDLVLTLEGIDEWRASIRDSIAAGGVTRNPNEITVLVSPEPGNPIIAAFGYNVGDYIFGTVRQSTSDDSRLFFTCLPIGRGACVLLVTVKAAGAYAYSGRIVKSLVDNPTFGPSLVYPLTDDNSTLVEIKPGPVNARDTRAVLVTQTECREIDVPQGAVSAVNTAYPDLGWNNTRVYAIDSPSGAELTVSIPSQTTNLTYEEQFTYFLGGQQRTASVGRRKVDAAIEYEVDSFGVEPGLMSDSGFAGLAQAIGSSPAAYSLINSPFQLFSNIDFADQQDVNGAFSSYESAFTRLASAGYRAPRRSTAFDVRENEIKAFEALFQGSDPPSFQGNALYADPGSLIESIPIARYRTLPMGVIGDRIPETDPLWSSLTRLQFAKPRVNIYAGLSTDQQTLYSDLNPIIFSDWGNRRLCQRQAFLLGFDLGQLNA